MKSAGFLACALAASPANLSPHVRRLDEAVNSVPSQTGTFAYNASTDTVELTWPANAAHNLWQRFYDVGPKFPGFLVPPTNSDGSPGPAAPVLSEAQATTFTPHPLGGVPLGLAAGRATTATTPSTARWAPARQPWSTRAL